MIYTTEVKNMCPVAKGAYHGPAPIPEEGKWVQAKKSDISGLPMDRLVCSSAGRMQADPEHQEGHH